MPWIKRILSTRKFLQKLIFTIWAVVNGCTVIFAHDFIKGNILYDCLFAYLDNIALPKWGVFSQIKEFAQTGANSVL